MEWSFQQEAAQLKILVAEMLPIEMLANEMLPIEMLPTG